MVINLVIAIAMLVVGIMLFTGKAVKYLKSYQDMEEKEKRNIKIDVLCKNISLLFFTAALIFGFAAASETFRQDWFKWVILGWFALGAADVVYIGKSKRFVHTYSPPKKPPDPFANERQRRRRRNKG